MQARCNLQGRVKHIREGLIDPARSPPMSAKCAHAITKAQRRPPVEDWAWNTGASLYPAIKAFSSALKW